MRGFVLAATLATVALLSPQASAVRPASGQGKYCRKVTCTCKSNDKAACAKECEADSYGCARAGEPLQWPSSCVGFAFDMSGSATLLMDDVRDAITKAFFAWTTVDCGGGRRPSIKLIDQGTVSCRKSEVRSSGPNVNVIYFRDDGWEYKSVDDTLATAKVQFDPKTGVIRDADIAINSAINDFTVGDKNVGQDLQAVMTHEAGHFLGLDHSSDPEATMYFAYDKGETKQRELSEDDVKAICAVYPPERDVPCDATPLGGLAASCDDEPSKLTCEAGGTQGVNANASAALLGFFGISLLGSAWTRRRSLQVARRRKT